MADEGYWRQTSDQKLVASAFSDSPVPTGHDFILTTTIEAAYSGEIWQDGKWDGSAYTPPDNIIVPFDLTTDMGMLQNAATLGHVQLGAWSSDLYEIAPYYPEEDVVVVHNFLTFGHRGLRGIMLSTFWSVAERVKAAEETASGFTDASTIIAMLELVEQARETDSIPVIAAPTQRIAFVNPTGAVRYTLAGSAEMTAADVEENMVAEAASYTVYPTGAWIAGITG